MEIIIAAYKSMLYLDVIGDFGVKILLDERGQESFGQTEQNRQLFAVAVARVQSDVK